MKRVLALLMAIGLPTTAAISTTAQSAPQGGAPQSVSRADFERWKKELSNWGRWGKDDQIGALNLITPAKRRQAAALVKEGFSVSLSRDADTEKAIDNPDPFEHSMIEIGTDRYGVVPHGVAHTHLDSLAHINYDGVFYNGYKPDADSVMKNRHTRNSIINLKNGIFTRGILIDLPRLKGVPYLEPGTPIYAQDIEAWEKDRRSQGVCGRCAVHSHRPLGAPRGRRSVRYEPHGQAIGTECIDASVAETARRRAAWRRRSTKPGSVGCRGGDRRGSRLRARLPRRAHLRQLRPRSAGRGRSRRASGGSSC